MSKILTPLTWYNSAGVLDESLTGTAHSYQFCSNTAYGRYAVAGKAGAEIEGAVAIGDLAQATNGGAVAIGGRVDGEESGATSSGGMSVAIGTSAKATATYAIAIGSGASAITQNTIQLGGSDIQYDLTVGNGAGTSKIGALSFDEVSPTNISSGGLYWCTAFETITVSGNQQIFGRNVFLWIETPRTTQAGAIDGGASFSYGDMGGTSTTWAIRVSGTNVSNLKCYKVFVK